MAQYGYPLDGAQNYTAAQAGAFFAGRSSGVYSAENNLKVTITGARQLTVSPGVAWITTEGTWGKVYVNTSNVNITVPIADGVLDFIVRIAVRWNKAQNKISIVSNSGTPSETPSAPTRNKTDEIYDLVLADYRVVHGETAIIAANLTDRRLNESLCGLMRDNVTGIPTAQLEAQFTSMLNALRTQMEDISEGTHASTHATGGADPLTPAAIGAATKSELSTKTLGASDWSGTEAPFTQTISVIGVTATSAVEILPDIDITAEQLEALQAANMQDGGQASGSITLKAFGDKPELDLPIRIIVRGDL